MIILLMGMKHCGKSTIGRRLGRRWQVEFHDADDLTCAAHGARTGEDLGFREIYTRYGKAYFRQCEARAVSEFFAGRVDSDKISLLSLGGGTAQNAGTADVLKQARLKVYLHVDPDELLQRIRRTGIPAFLDADDVEGSFARLYQQREPVYRELADLTVELTGLSKAGAAEKTAGAIETRLADRRLPCPS
ncbi:MAG: shikimate kinase [Planctomycetota bacterium]